MILRIFSTILVQPQFQYKYVLILWGWANFITLSNHHELYLKIVLGRYLKAVQACIYIHVCLTHRLKKCLFGCFTFFLTLLFTKEFFEEHKNFGTIAKLLCPNWWNGYFCRMNFSWAQATKWSNMYIFMHSKLRLPMITSHKILSQENISICISCACLDAPDSAI